MRVRQELLRAARSKASVRWRLVLLMAIAGTFVVFLGVNEIIARMTIPFGCRTAIYKKNRPARRSVFLWLMQNSG